MNKGPLTPWIRPIVKLLKKKTPLLNPPAPVTKSRQGCVALTPCPIEHSPWRNLSPLPTHQVLAQTKRGTSPPRVSPHIQSGCPGSILWTRPDHGIQFRRSAVASVRSARGSEEAEHCCLRELKGSRGADSLLRYVRRQKDRASRPPHPAAPAPDTSTPAYPQPLVPGKRALSEPRPARLPFSPGTGTGWV